MLQNEIKLHARGFSQRNFPQIITLRELGDIPQTFMANLVVPMRRRCVSQVNTCGGHTHPWHMRTLLTASLPYGVINAYISAPISSKLAVCSTTKIITVISRWLCVMSHIGEKVDDLRTHSLFFPSIYLSERDTGFVTYWNIAVLVQYPLIYILRPSKTFRIIPPLHI